MPLGLELINIKHYTCGISIDLKIAKGVLFTFYWKKKP